MHILSIHGSPKGKGNTQKTAHMVTERMKQLDESLTFEDIYLKDLNLDGCKGCFQCLSLGVDKCPIKDDQLMMEQKMIDADAVIFTTPVYAANVSGLFKNFLDRFAYICHRPMFYGKKAMVICTTGSEAAGIVNTITKITVGVWGFEVVTQIGGIISPDVREEDAKKQWMKVQKDADKAGEKFYKALTKERPTKVEWIKLYAFHLQKKCFKYADPNKADFKYWRGKGWLDKKAKYYIDVPVNPIQYGLMKITANIMSNRYPRGKFVNEL